MKYWQCSLIGAIVGAIFGIVIVCIAGFIVGDFSTITSQAIGISCRLFGVMGLVIPSLVKWIYEGQDF